MLEEIEQHKEAITELLNACRNGNLTKIDELLSMGIDANDYMLDAVIPAEGDLPAVEFLLSNGANINDSNVHGEIAANLAAASGHLRVSYIKRC